MNAARLNVFQRLVRQWDTVHPYNAAQLLRLQGAPDPHALQLAWHATLATLGIGPVSVTGRTFRYEGVNGDAHRYTIDHLPPGTTLQHYLSEQMNRPFVDGDLPLRPFIIKEAGSFYVGVVYAHWIADSASIRLLLKEWFVRVYDPPAASAQAVRISRGGYWRLFGPHRSRWRLGEQIWTLFRSATRFRRVRKLRSQGSSDFHMKYALHHAPPGLLQKLLVVAKKLGVTLNDVFMAAMAEVCEHYIPVKQIRRRQDVALGMIVDLRPRAQVDLSNVFGLFLGFANVICRRADLGNWSRLVRSIARQTRIHKETDSPQASSVWMFVAVAASRFVPPHKSFRFYRKHMPLAGGISNVNLNHTWAAKYHPHVLLEYIRVSPTGPMVPLVFTTTTLGKDFHFGLTYRSALFPDGLADEIAAHFVTRLQAAAAGTDMNLPTPKA